MKNKNWLYFLVLTLLPFTGWAQLRPNMDLMGGGIMDNPFNRPGTDTTGKKQKKDNWDETPAVLYYKYNNSEVKHYYDSSTLFFHRNKIQQPVWYKDLGNWGSTVNNLMFTPYTTPGLHLGYHVWDVYRVSLDSIPFINTTRPYTSFSYMLGSKQMQWVNVLHTQNINPKWNFAINIRNNSSSGFFNLQRASAVNGFFSSNYESTNERYKVKLALFFNNFKQDENGGIVSEDDLTKSIYTNRENLPVVYPYSSKSPTRSAINNRQREIVFYLSNSYAWGKKDSLYNEDSTKATYRFTPRFSIKHALEWQQTKHYFLDGLPDSARYVLLGNFSFKNNDTVRSTQQWWHVDNKFSLNTFLGKDSQLINVEAGIGLRFERFSNDYFIGITQSNFLNSFVFGQINKEAIKPGQWAYDAKVLFFFSGKAIGNLNLQGGIAKNFSKLGTISINAVQAIVNPAQSAIQQKTNFYEINNNLLKTSTTTVSGVLDITRLKLQAGIRNHLLANYIYYDKNLKVAQQTEPFNVLQIFGRKLFVFGRIYLDNEAVWQQATANAPLHVPAIMLRHQFAYKLPLFKGKLETFLGVEARYNSPYFADGYAPMFNQFYYQNTVKINNPIELEAFFNFKVKRLRAFLVGDQLQQLFIKKNAMNYPGYPAPNAHIRFGFNWLMMN